MSHKKRITKNAAELRLFRIKHINRVRPKGAAVIKNGRKGGRITFQRKHGLFVPGYLQLGVGLKVAMAEHPDFRTKAGIAGGAVVGPRMVASGQLAFALHLQHHVYRDRIPKSKWCLFCDGHRKPPLSNLRNKYAMQFESALEIDRRTLEDWAARDVDESHHNIPAEFWLTGAPGSYLNFKIVDAQGPVMFVRLEAEGINGEPYCRVSTQFAPEDVVSKRRLVLGLLFAFKVFIPHLQSESFHGLVTKTVFTNLARFLEKQGFARVEGTSDYRLIFMAAPAASSSESTCVTVQN